MKRIISIWPAALPDCATPFTQALPMAGIHPPEETKQMGIFVAQHKTAASPESPVIIEIPDGMGQADYLGFNTGVPGTEYNARTFRNISAQEIAQHIAQYWNDKEYEYLSERPRRGIWVEEDGVPLAEQIATMKVYQRAFFEKTMQEAQQAWALWKDKGWMPSALDLLAAKQLRMTPDWLVSPVTVQRTNCQWCGHVLNAQVALCPNCKQIVNKPLYDQLVAGQAVPAPPVVPPPAVRNKDPRLAGTAA